MMEHSILEELYPQSQGIPDLQQKSGAGSGPDDAAVPMNAPGAVFEAGPETGLEATLVEAVLRLLLRKRLVLTIALLITLAGTLLAFALPVQYTAETKLMPPQQTPPAASLWMNQLASSSAGGALTAVAAKQLGVKSQNDIYLGLLASRPVADAIIQKFGLQQQYRSRDSTAARETLARNTRVTMEKNGFISLSVTDTSRLQAPAMANTYTSQLRILLKTLAVTESSQRRLFYEDQLQHAREALADSESTLQKIQQKEGLVQLEAQAKAMIEGMAALRAQVAAKQVEVEAIRSYSTDRNPEVQLAERELASLQQQAALLDQKKRSGRSDPLGLQDVPGAGLEYLRAEHEVKYRQTMFDIFLKQLDAARLDEAQEAAIIQVVEPAIEPDRSSSPHRFPIVLASAALGLLLGCLCALLPWGVARLLADPARRERLRHFRNALASTTSRQDIHHHA